MKQSGSWGQSPPDAHGIIAGHIISHPHASPSFPIAFNHSTKMNILKYHFRKKYLHNRNQGWINLALLLMAATVVCCYKPAYRWLTETIENNILLSLTLCAGGQQGKGMCRQQLPADHRDGCMHRHPDHQGMQGAQQDDTSGTGCQGTGMFPF